METLLNNAIPLILAFQDLGEWLLGPMKAFSFLGTEDFYILVIPIIYWSFDSALGLRIGVIMLFSSGINTIFKFAFHLPRPYWINTEVQALSAESSFGVPSGHAQNAIAIWGMVGSYFRKNWVWIISLFFIIGISLSRLYLAVHFPLDTVVGLLIGLLLLLTVNRVWAPVSAWAKEQSLLKLILVSLAGTLSMLFLGVFIAWIFRDWAMPVEWMQNAVRAGDEAPHPFSISGLVSTSATLFGLFAGVAWIEQHGGFDAAGSAQQKLLRYLLGVVGLAVFYLGLKMVFPSGENFVAYIFRYLRYALVGFWVSGVAPFIFLKVKLVDSPER